MSTTDDKTKQTPPQETDPTAAKPTPVAPSNKASTNHVEGHATRDTEEASAYHTAGHSKHTEDATNSVAKEQAEQSDRKPA